MLLAKYFFGKQNLYLLLLNNKQLINIDNPTLLSSLVYRNLIIHNSLYWRINLYNLQHMILLVFQH